MCREKLYCYVDETGQETRGVPFLVAIVLCGSDRDQLASFLLGTELKTGKRLKWHRSRHAHRVEYLREVVGHTSLRGNLFYSVYRDPASYLEATVDGIARAVRKRGSSTARLTVIIDGLRGSDVTRVSMGLRARGVYARKVRGLREESDPILRLRRRSGRVPAGLRRGSQLRDAAPQ